MSQAFKFASLNKNKRMVEIRKALGMPSSTRVHTFEDGSSIRIQVGKIFVC